MKKTYWKSKIKKGLQANGTYKQHYDPLIDTLAGILNKRDVVEEQYVNGGEMPVIEYTNKSGATNEVENPCLTTWINLNKTALAYWKELGLTPASSKEAPKTEDKTDRLGEIRSKYKLVK